MTLQQLRYLVALADTGHFGKAAEFCHVSQSTLSTQLKKLEDILGITLFDRDLKRILPTPLGQEILQSARIMLRESERLRELARYGQDPLAASLHIGVIPTLAPYYLPRVLPLLHKRYPKLKLLLHELTTPMLLQELHAGKLAAGLVALPVLDAELTVTPIFKEPFVAAFPRSHALLKHKTVSLEALGQENLLLLEEGHCLRDQALAACGLASHASEEVRATSLETLRQMVGMGIGVTLLPYLASQGHTLDNKDIVLRPLAGAGASRSIALVWRKRTPFLDSLRALAETLRAELPAGVNLIQATRTNSKK